MRSSDSCLLRVSDWVRNTYGNEKAAKPQHRDFEYILSSYPGNNRPAKSKLNT